MNAVVDVSDGTVSINEFEISDSAVVKHFEEINEDERVEELGRVLELGVQTVDLAATSGREEFVERKFEEMQSEFETEIERIENEVEEKFGTDGEVPEVFEEHLGNDGTLRQQLDDAFGEGGVFVERLDEELGEDGERISDALDPDTDGTPTNRLRSSLKGEIRAIGEKVEAAIADSEAREDVRERTTLSGDDFEDDLHEILLEQVNMTTHEVDRTADEEGELSGREIGDFVLDLGDTGQRIVIEAKSKDISKDEMKSQLDESIQNRDADYGILVFETTEQAGKEIGYFHEFNQNMLAISVGDSTENPPDQGYLKIGFNWARTRLAQQNAESGSEIDPEAVQSGIEDARENINRLSNIKRKLTNLSNTVGDIKQDVDDVKNDAVECLDQTQRRLTADSDTS